MNLLLWYWLCKHDLHVGPLLLIQTDSHWNGLNVTPPHCLSQLGVDSRCWPSCRQRALCNPPLTPVLSSEGLKGNYKVLVITCDSGQTAVIPEIIGIRKKEQSDLSVCSDNRGLLVSAHTHVGDDASRILIHAGLMDWGVALKLLSDVWSCFRPVTVTLCKLSPEMDEGTSCVHGYNKLWDVSTHHVWIFSCVRTVQPPLYTGCVVTCDVGYFYPLRWVSEFLHAGCGFFFRICVNS